MAQTRVGVAIPCRVSDVSLAEKYPLPTLQALDPVPHKVLVLVNDGTRGLKEYRTRLFDSLFLEHGCDVVLSACTDYRFIDKKLMTKMDPVRVQNYGRVFTTPVMSVLFFVLRILARNPWSSMYSLPKRVWFEQIRDSPIFDGTDGSIPRAVGMDYESHMGVSYMLMRRNTKGIIRNALFSKYSQEKHLIKRVIKMLKGLHI